MDFQEYVCGFMVTGLTLDVDFGVFIQKNRPAFQAGLWNGVGGKIERFEPPLAAMVREFTEETGCKTNASDWQHTISLRGSNFVVHYYRNLQPDGFPDITSITDEPVAVWQLRQLLNEAPILDNMRWILPLTLSNRVQFPITVNHLLSDEAKLQPTQLINSR